MQTLWFETALLPDGWADRVLLSIDDDGRIAAVFTGVEAGGADCHGAAITGLANLHSHAFQRGMAGLAEYRGSESDDFWSWRELMYRFLDRLDPDNVESIAALAYAEMLEAGYTRVGEFHYLHHAPGATHYADPAEMATRIVAAASTTGIGLTLLPVHYRYAGFGKRPPEPGHVRFVTDISEFELLYARSMQAIAALPGADIGVAPHSLRAVDAGDLSAITSLADGRPVHIHAAEQQLEVEHCLAALGARPVDWLLDNADVDSRWCLIHSTHLGASETVRFAASGAVAGLCPMTEANLGDGVFPAPAFLASAGRFGIGTDSSIVIDPARELQMMEYAQRLQHQRRNLLGRPDRPATGGSLYAGALAGGAQSLGQDHVGLRVGAPADIVELDTDALALVGRTGDMLIDGWIFAGERGVVKSVWRSGRKVVADGRHHDGEAIRRRYRCTMLKLLGD